jgi:hypothetical protein
MSARSSGGTRSPETHPTSQQRALTTNLAVRFRFDDYTSYRSPQREVTSMPMYKVRSHGVSYLVESSSRESAFLSVVTELIAAQLRVLLPPDLSIEDWDELEPFKDNIQAIAAGHSCRGDQG